MKVNGIILAEKNLNQVWDYHKQTAVSQRQCCQLLVMNFLQMPCFLSSQKNFIVTLTNSLGTLPLLHEFTSEICKRLNSRYGLQLDKQLPGKAFQQELFRQKSFWLSLTFSVVKSIYYSCNGLRWPFLENYKDMILKRLCSYQSNLVIIL